MTTHPPHPDFFPNHERLNEANDGTLVVLGAFRSVFDRDYGEAARALERATERRRELTEMWDTLITSQRECRPPESEP